MWLEATTQKQVRAGQRNRHLTNQEEAMRGFSIDTQDHKPTKAPAREPAAFVPLDCNKPQFAHLKTTSRRFVTLVSKVDPQYQKHFG